MLAITSDPKLVGLGILALLVIIFVLSRAMKGAGEIVYRGIVGPEEPGRSDGREGINE